MTANHRHRSPHTRALGIYVLLAVVVTFPMVLQFWDHVVGHADSDVWAHVWGYWRTERALLQDLELPTRVDYLNFPHGGVLYHVDLLNSLLVLPFRVVLGSTISFNLLVLAQLVGGAYAAFLLTRHLTDRVGPSILAGAAYGFCPYVLSMGLSSGVSERLNTAWMPLFVLCVLRAVETRKRGYAVAAGVLCLLTAAGCYKYCIFLASLSAVLFTYLLVRPLAWRALGARRGPSSIRFRDSVLAVGLTTVSCAVMVLPLGLYARQLTGDEAALFQRQGSMLWNGSIPLENYTPFTLADFLVPGHSRFFETQYFDLLVQEPYVGWSLLLLGLASVLSRRRFVRFFFPTALLFLLLAMGPDPSPMGALSFVYEGLARVVPYFSYLRNPWEMVLVVSMCLAVAGGAGLAGLLDRVRGRWRTGLMGLASVAVAVDLLVFTIAPVPVSLAPVEVPQVYRDLAADVEDYGVFDYPPYRACSTLKPEEYLLFQTVHHKAIPHAINESWLEEDPFWGAAIRHQRCEHPGFDPRPADAEAALMGLSADGFRFFVLHRDMMAPGGAELFEQLLAGSLGEPVVREGDLAVYWLGAVSM